MERLNPSSRSDAYGRKLNRVQSPLIAYGVPWVTIVLGSILPQFVIAPMIPLVPPLGFVLMLAWRLQRPGLLPVWAGFPLGLIDDLFSGQPFGSAIVLWSGAMLALEYVEVRFPWSSFFQDWFRAGMIALAYLIAGLVFSGAQPTIHALIALLPQMLLTILIFPFVARLVGTLDQIRLIRWRKVH